VRGKVLMVEERDDILRGICENLSARAIAARLGRDRSVISREITRTVAGTATGCTPPRSGTRR
jgi:transposase, IS30 family